MVRRWQCHADKNATVNKAEQDWGNAAQVALGLPDLAHGLYVCCEKRVRPTQAASTRAARFGHRPLDMALGLYVSWRLAPRAALLSMRRSVRARSKKRVPDLFRPTRGTGT